MKRCLAVGAVALVAAGAIATLWLRPSEARRIRRQLERLCECVSKAEGEGNAVMALKMNALGDLFDSQVTVEMADFPGNGTYAGDEIASHVARFRPSFRALRLSCHDVHIDPPEGGEAQVRFTARLTGVAGNGETQEDTRAVQARLRAGPDRAWRFSQFAEVIVLQR